MNILFKVCKRSENNINLSENTKMQSDAFTVYVGLPYGCPLSLITNLNFYSILFYSNSVHNHYG